MGKFSADSAAMNVKNSNIITLFTWILSAIQKCIIEFFMTFIAQKCRFLLTFKNN